MIKGFTSESFNRILAAGGYYLPLKLAVKKRDFPEERIRIQKPGL
jgi:hypothetical protein